MGTMSKETLSALLDNEADDLELRRLLGDWDKLSAAEQDELSQTWSRYHLAQSLLHDQGVAVSDTLSARISAQLDEEPELAGRRPENRWREHLLKAAIAASVAAVFVVGMQNSLQAPEPATPVASTEPAMDNTPTEEDSPSLLADSEPDPEARQLLLDYIQGIEIDPSEPAGFEHIADSPLYRLVNQLQETD